MFDIENVKWKRRTWIKAAASPDTFRKNWLLEDCQDVAPEVMDDIKRWLEGARAGKIIKSNDSIACGKGLILYGKPGRGKTTIAMAILNEIATTFSLKSLGAGEKDNLIRPVYFTTLDKFISLKSLTMSKDITPSEETLYYGLLGEALNDAYNVRVLVLDDLGKEHIGPTGWQKSLLHQLLRSRHSQGLPTIITSNVPVDNWAPIYGDATESFAREAFAYVPVDSDKGDLRK